MSPSNETQSPISVENLAITAIEGLGFVALTTIYNHRELTHQSLKAKQPLRFVARTAMFGLGVRPRIWADVHRTHHSHPDANIGPILETADLLEWLDTHPERAPEGIPGYFPKSILDPDAELSVDDVKRIGSAARSLVKDRYKVTEDYSDDEIGRLLDTTSPRFFYPDKIPRSAKAQEKPEASPPGSIRRLFPELRDPHSPALHKQGVFGVLRYNVHLYKQTAGYYMNDGTDNPGKVSGDIWDEKIYDRTALGIAAFFVGNIAIKSFLNRGQGKNKLIRATAEGSAISLLAMGALVWGGKITNAYGHAGAAIKEGGIFGEAAEVLRGGKPRVKPDGTYTSRSKLLSLPTFDEVGGQEDHHKLPWNRAYSHQTGIKRIIEAPFGSMLDLLAKKRILMKPGDQFGHKEIEAQNTLTVDPNQTDHFYRPDEPTKAVLLLQEARAKTLHKEQILED